MIEEYKKDFERWNKKKQTLESRILPADFFFLEGKVWWAALGVNIGQEIDGKNDMFERPIVVLKKISENLLLAVPITTSIHSGLAYSYTMKYQGKLQMVLLFQQKIISSKRLLRLISRLNQNEFSEIRFIAEEMLSSIKTIPSD